MKLEFSPQTTLVVDDEPIYAMVWPLVNVLYVLKDNPARFNRDLLGRLVKALRHDIFEGDIGSSHVMEDAQGQLLLSGQREAMDRYRLDFTPYGLSSLIHGLEVALEDLDRIDFQTLVSYPFSTIAALHAFLVEVSQDPTPRVLELPDLESSADKGWNHSALQGFTLHPIGAGGPKPRKIN